MFSPSCKQPLIFLGLNKAEVDLFGAMSETVENEVMQRCSG